MRLIKTTKPKDIALAGINISTEVVDGILRGLTFRDSDGGLLRVVVRNYNELHVEIPEPIKMVKRWKLSGTVLDLPVEKTFDTEREAERAKDEYLDQCSSAILEIKDSEIADPELYTDTTANENFPF